MSHYWMYIILKINYYLYTPLLSIFLPLNFLYTPEASSRVNRETIASASIPRNVWIEKIVEMQTTATSTRHAWYQPVKCTDQLTRAITNSFSRI